MGYNLGDHLWLKLGSLRSIVPLQPRQLLFDPSYPSSDLVHFQRVRCHMTLSCISYYLAVLGLTFVTPIYNKNPQSCSLTSLFLVFGDAQKRLINKMVWALVNHWGMVVWSLGGPPLLSWIVYQVFDCLAKCK